MTEAHVPDGQRNGISQQAHMATAETAGAFLNANQSALPAEIRKALLKLGYKSDFLLMAGFNEELIEAGIEYEEVFIVLEQDLRVSNLETLSRVLLPVVAPFSGVVYTPSETLVLPLLPDAADSGKTHPAPISAQQEGENTTSSPQDSTGNEHLVQSPVVGSQQPTRRANATTDTTQSQDTIAHEESSRGGSGDRPKTREGAVKNTRRNLNLNLWAPLQLKVPDQVHDESKTSDQYTFDLRTSIEVELARNEDGHDWPTGLLILDPWCFLNFSSIRFRSSPSEIYSLERVRVAAELTPMASFPHRIPLTRYTTGGEELNRQRGWEFNLSAGQKGIGTGLGATNQPLEGRYLAERRWGVESIRTIVPERNCIRLTSDYFRNPDHTEVVTEDDFEPGPHAVVSSPSEDGRKLRIQIKSFWSSVKSFSSLWERDQTGGRRDSRPFLFANFWHIAEFEIDLSKGTTDPLGENNSGSVDDMIGGARKERDGPHPHVSTANIEVRDGEDCTVQLVISVKRAVIRALAGRDEQESPSNSKGCIIV